VKSFTDTFFYQSANKDFPTLEQNQWEEQQEDARGDGVQAEQLHEHDYVHAQRAINEHQCLLLHHPHRSHHADILHPAPRTRHVWQPSFFHVRLTTSLTTTLLPNTSTHQHVDEKDRQKKRKWTVITGSFECDRLVCAL